MPGLRLSRGGVPRRVTGYALVTLGLIAACGPVKPPVPPSGRTHNVVAIGDSYASGQGAPNAPIGWWPPRWRPEWDDERCNRSKNAATVQAIELLEADPAFVGDAFVHESFACSGLMAKLLGQALPPTTCVKPAPGDACTRPCGSSYLP